ncbi:autophagy-related protein 101-like, partial [Saccoglossus kowalevskii]
LQSVEGRQIEEVVLSIFHTLLFHRTTGKFHYKREGTYSIGTVGFIDKDCDFIDFTFVRCSSNELDQALKREISAFKDGLRNSEGPLTGQITLEFYQRKKTRWPFPSECIPWEVWTIKLNVVTLTNEYERQICREKVGEILGEKVSHQTSGPPNASVAATMRKLFKDTLAL